MPNETLLGECQMPECLEEFLETLEADDARAVIAYLQSQPEAVDNMVELIVQSVA